MNRRGGYFDKLAGITPIARPEPKITPTPPSPPPPAPAPAKEKPKAEPPEEKVIPADKIFKDAKKIDIKQSDLDKVKNILKKRPKTAAKKPIAKKPIAKETKDETTETMRELGIDID